MVVQVLLSVSVFVTILLLVGVVAASYVGTTVALKRFFDGESRDVRQDHR
ncbi:hypothetical protein [Natronorubrum texcoconense]|uniref:Uncharacterized protein n=1 Tax=Natronorubrum texcoconense TaxID=1095776 RepID=A0A1G9BU90_9EURY|nr:hypothetical protein [Natronorubrum texcoconense]SDK43038.1 hypothetical protein SAMN04515672_3092 [Natronorubrum texcoconense]